MRGRILLRLGIFADPATQNVGDWTYPIYLCIVTTVYSSAKIALDESSLAFPPNRKKNTCIDLYI